MIKNQIWSHFDENYPGVYSKVDNLGEIVTTIQNFDELLIPEDHVGRKLTDTYYVDEKHVLRTHTSVKFLLFFSQLPVHEKPIFVGLQK